MVNFADIYRGLSFQDLQTLNPSDINSVRNL